MTEYRCKFCHKLLFKGRNNMYDIEIKCPKCGKINKVEGWEFPKEHKS